MKSICVAVAAALTLALSSGLAAASPKKSKEGKTKEGKAKGKSDVRHVVAFKFKDSAKPEEIKRVEEAFAALKNKIPQIQKYEWGLNNSPEGLNKGMTHGFILTFANEKDRNDYLEHPDHKAFGALLKPILADVFVIDFVSRR